MGGGEYQLSMKITDEVAKSTVTQLPPFSACPQPGRNGGVGPPGLLRGPRVDLRRGFPGFLAGVQPGGQAEGSGPSRGGRGQSITTGKSVPFK